MQDRKTEHYKNSPESEGKEYPLTVGQKGLWFLHQLDPLSDRYHMPLTFKFCKQVNVNTLEKILTTFIQRHSMMSSTFHEVDGVPVRRVNSPLTIRMIEHDIPDSQQQDLLQEIRKLSGKPFDLANGPLIRAHVLNGYQGDKILLLTIHHLIFDGASLKLLCDELEQIYQSLTNSTELKAVEYDYNDFQIWQQQWLQSEDAQLSQSYWLDKLSGELPQLNLPTDNVSNKNETIKGEFLKFAIPKSIVDNFKQLALDKKCSEYLIWLSVYFAFLSRYTSQQDIIVGTPSMGRPEAQFDEFVGYFVNLIPVRCQLQPHENFIDLLHRFKNDIYEALMHADYPLPELINALGDVNQRGDQPLFQTSFIWTVTEHLKSKDDSQLGLEIYPLLHESGEQNLSMELITSEEGMNCLLKYRTNCFSATSISRIQQSFLNFIDSISIEPDCEIQELSLVTEDEENFLLHTLNDTQRDYPNEWCIHQLFEEQVKKMPDEVALIFEERSLSYVELNKQANQLAHYLIEQGVNTDSLVGLCVERSPEMIVALLAILKAGGAYLPLDPTYPDARLQHMIEDSALTVLLTQQGLLSIAKEKNIQQLFVDNAELHKTISLYSSENPVVVGLTSSQLAYVIYTSGSTGQPKGVLQKHSTIVNLVYGQASDTGLSKSMRTLQFAPISFDVSIQEIATCWYSASPLIIISNKAKEDLNKLPQLIQYHKIERMFLPPVVLNWLAEELIKQDINMPNVKEIIVAGEALLVSKYLKNYLLANPQCRLWNHYGPTESHVATIALVDVNKDQASVPIGFVLANLSVFILDPQQQIVPYGAVGELYIGGAGLARGYLNRAELTSERFIQHPYSYDSHDVLYRTGDLVRYLDDKQLEFIGRIDDQVKIRGFRIELGEIEQQLNNFSAVQTALVIVHEAADKQQRLIAYLTRQQVEQNTIETVITEQDFIAQLRSNLQMTLPDYMIPAVIIVLENFSLTANGKIDKKALPEPDASLFTGEYLAPEGEIELMMAAIWSELLQLPQTQISADAHFFELGGHSLLVAKLINSIKKKIDLEIEYIDVFNFPTLRNLSIVMDNKLQTNSLIESFTKSDSDSIEELEW